MRIIQILSLVVLAGISVVTLFGIWGTSTRRLDSEAAAEEDSLSSGKDPSSVSGSSVEGGKRKSSTRTSSLDEFLKRVHGQRRGGGEGKGKAGGKGEREESPASGDSDSPPGSVELEEGAVEARKGDGEEGTSAVSSTEALNGTTLTSSGEDASKTEGPGGEQKAGGEGGPEPSLQLPPGPIPASASVSSPEAGSRNTTAPEAEAAVSPSAEMPTTTNTTGGGGEVKVSLTKEGASLQKETLGKGGETGEAVAGVTPVVTNTPLPLGALTLGDDVRGKTGEPLESASWAPLSVTECSPLAAQYGWAPCLKTEADRIALEQPDQEPPIETFIAFAEELIFPPFVISLPDFISPDHENHWLTRFKTKPLELFRCNIDLPTRSAHFLHELHAQNLVFENVTLLGPPPENWGQTSCHGTEVSHRLFRGRTAAEVERAEAAGGADLVLFARGPDSYSFQHWVDRITHEIAQAEHIWGPLKRSGGVVKVIGGRNPRDGVIRELFEASGLGADNVRFGSPEKEFENAHRFLFNCRTMLIHPWLFLRFAELIGVHRDTPMEERKTVYWLGRGGRSERNGGRRILNEKAVLDMIEALLKKRGKGEKLEVLDTKKGLPKLIEEIGKNARALVGPHGGKFFNQILAPRDTLILEIQPSSKGGLYFWEIGGCLLQKYAYFVVESRAPSHDMNVPVDQLEKLLDRNLGVVSQTPSLRPKMYFHPDQVFVKRGGGKGQNMQGNLRGRNRGRKLSESTGASASPAGEEEVIVKRNGTLSLRWKGNSLLGTSGKHSGFESFDIEEDEEFDEMSGNGDDARDLSELVLSGFDEAEVQTRDESLQSLRAGFWKGENTPQQVV
uniref:Glycosyltransferase 61 catalytic domain-containing protein n=1 Tax=Chromera velia CCMP2878 TaxID=1169474 RepID=A0A0G4GLZ1_9ALVE|eukprot:Cvel_22478.t1-p1 / transcript=Cvel_22478.t1 / gene=Cvel_22478 / organism=Chromera_velia_CCMP2878 / gene_product=hypothetical protein / transcript_product=hypothetical protein / location=Cvel_scaffold2213:2696-6464(-) / protein_length=843 / sequence_SO=supercontig / SO=protein_coding / is_pseudo=false